MNPLSAKVVEHNEDSPVSKTVIIQNNPRAHRVFGVRNPPQKFSNKFKKPSKGFKNTPKKTLSQGKNKDELSRDFKTPPRKLSSEASQSLNEKMRSSKAELQRIDFLKILILNRTTRDSLELHSWQYSHFFLRNFHFGSFVSMLQLRNY